MYNDLMTAAPRTPTARVAAVDVFHALSDETRLAVLEMLRGGERCVCDLQDALEAAQSRLSFHLKVLKDAGLVTDRKEGRWSYYALNADRFTEVSEILNGFAVAAVTPAPVRLHSLARAQNGASPKTVKSRASAGRVMTDTRDGCC